jgi:hypothetical protein
MSERKEGYYWVKFFPTSDPYLLYWWEADETTDVGYWTHEKWGVQLYANREIFWIAKKPISIPKRFV